MLMRPFMLFGEPLPDAVVSRVQLALEEAYALDPDDALVLCDCASARARAGDIGGAIAALETAATIGRNRPMRPSSLAASGRMPAGTTQHDDERQAKLAQFNVGAATDLLADHPANSRPAPFLMLAPEVFARPRVQRHER
jgi:hypothetical protein